METSQVHQAEARDLLKMQMTDWTSLSESSKDDSLNQI